MEAFGNEIVVWRELVCFALILLEFYVSTNMYMSTYKTKVTYII